MRAFYAIFMCPHCLSILKPGNLQIGLLTGFTLFGFAALACLFINFEMDLWNIPMPLVFFFASVIFYIASSFCKNTVTMVPGSWATEISDDEAQFHEEFPGETASDSERIT